MDDGRGEMSVNSCVPDMLMEHDALQDMLLHLAENVREATDAHFLIWKNDFSSAFRNQFARPEDLHTNGLHADIDDVRAAYERQLLRFQ